MSINSLHTIIFILRYESIADASGGDHGSPKIVTYREEEKSSYSKPYLILDIREKVAYERGHLLQARSFPNTLLRRDQIPPELYNFRNKSGFLIIIYCDDEKESREAAKTFVDRGLNPRCRLVNCIIYE